MKENNAVLELLLKSISTIQAKNVEIERLKREIKELKEHQKSTSVNINFFSVTEEINPINLSKNIKVQMEKAIQNG